MQDIAGEAGTSSSVMFSYGPPHMAEQKQDDQLKPTYSSSVMIWDVALRTYQKQWTIGRSDERGSGMSALAAGDDDDDDDEFQVQLVWIQSLLLDVNHCEGYGSPYPPAMNWIAPLLLFY